MEIRHRQNNGRFYSKSLRCKFQRVLLGYIIILLSYILAICNNGCNHGRCIRPSVCSCNLGYRGSTCNEGSLMKHFIVS